MIPVLGHEHPGGLHVGAELPVKDLVITVLASAILVIILGPVHVINIPSLYTRTARSLTPTSILERHNDVTHVV